MYIGKTVKSIHFKTPRAGADDHGDPETLLQ